MSVQWAGHRVRHVTKQRLAISGFRDKASRVVKVATAQQVLSCWANSRNLSAKPPAACLNCLSSILQDSTDDSEMCQGNPTY